MDAPKSSKQPTAGELQIWREAMTQLRHLADDFNRTFHFQIGVHVVLLIAICFIMRFHAIDGGSVFLLLVLILAGIVIGLVGHYVMERQRIYYLQMLAKKSLFEEDFGFYESRFAESSTDFALPWRLTAQVIADIRKDLDAWVKRSVRGPGTIARWQFVALEVLLAIYGVILVMLAIVKS